jgi:hypothetical protein
MPNKVIAVTLSHRIGYTHWLLEALCQCYGFDEYKVIFSVDWDERYPQDSDEVLNMASGFRTSCHDKTEIYRHRPRLGIDENKLWVLPRAFEETDFVICLEDDTIPAPDFLRYMEWAELEFRGIAKVLAVSGYHKLNEPLPSRIQKSMFEAFGRKGFNTWGWGMWKDRWQRFMADDAAHYRKYAGALVNGKFDAYFRDIALAQGLYTIQPRLARIQNVGKDQGEHAVPEEFLRIDYNEHGVWEYDVADYDPHDIIWRYYFAD